MREGESAEKGEGGKKEERRPPGRAESPSVDLLLFNLPPNGCTTSQICRVDEQRLLTALGEGATPRLTALSLVDCGLGDRGCALLAAALLHAGGGGLRRLQALELSINRIHRAGRELGAAVVAGCPDLRSLVLAGNPLGREGVELLLQVRRKAGPWFMRA